MEKSLKDKVRDALLEATSAQAHIELEDVPPDRVVGLVLSELFAPLSPSQRQDHIWSYLDRELTDSERSRVVFIVTDTPDEYEALRRATA